MICTKPPVDYYTVCPRYVKRKLFNSFYVAKTHNLRVSAIENTSIYPANPLKQLY